MLTRILAAHMSRVRKKSVDEAVADRDRKTQELSVACSTACTKWQGAESAPYLRRVWRMFRAVRHSHIHNIL